MAENNLPVYEKTTSEKAEIRLSSEDSIPEYLPNMARIVKVNVYACTAEKTAEENALTVSVHITYSVLYVSDFHDRMKCAVFTDTGTHTFPIKGLGAILSGGGFADVSVCPVLGTAQNTGTRRLKLSSVIRLQCEVVSKRCAELFCPSEAEELKLLEKQVTVLDVTETSESDLHVTGTIPLDGEMPGADEVVYTDASLCVQSCEVRDGMLRVSGQALVNCMFLAGENPEGTEYISLTKELPFSGETPVATEDAPPLCAARLCIGSVSGESVRDSYGDGRGIAVDITAKMTARLYGSVGCRVVEDVFCLCHDCTCEVREQSYDTLSGMITESAEITERVRTELGSITKLLFATPVSCSVGLEVSEGKTWAVGRVELSLTGTSDLGAPASAVCSVPYRFRLSGTAETDKPKYDAALYVCHVECTIENGEVKCTLGLLCRAVLYRCASALSVTALSIDEQNEVRRSRSEYIIYYPDSADTVWSVAKKYRIPPEALVRANSLMEAESLSERRNLIIPR